MPSNVFLFAANDQKIGNELWISDGTPDGTVLLKDINVGTVSSNPSEFVPLGNGRAIFTADDGVAGRELWVTDGTTAGTVLAKDVRLGPASSAPLGYFALGDGKALFQANDGVNSIELWITDGTSGGTSMVRDIAVGLASSSPGGFAALGSSRFVFAANDGSVGIELWVTDGTTSGTVLVKDLRVGSNTSSSAPSQLVSLRPGLVLFTAVDTNVGGELWSTDGTSAGTVLLKNINPGASSSAIVGLTVLSTGRAVFLADNGTSGRELWITDGTAGGTTLIKDVRSGSQSGFDPALTTLTELSGGRFLFAADAGLSGTEVWISDGTSLGTVQLADIAPNLDNSNPYGFRALGNGRMVFTAISPTKGAQPWVTDGTAAGTKLLVDMLPPAPLTLANAATTNGPYYFTPVGDGRAVFRGLSGIAGRELWITDGTKDGTVLLKDIALKGLDSLPGGFTALTINGTVPKTTTPLQFNGTVTDTPSNTLYIGGDGTDIVELAEGLRAATFSILPSGDVQVARANQSDMIRGVEQVRFLDGRMVFDATDPASSVTRLYQAALGRAPDQGGLNYWIGAVSTGKPLADLAASFLNSPEFTSRFGTGLSNTDFVTRIYVNVLNRAPDAGGLAFFRDGLDAGRATRGQTLAIISESNENKSATSALVSAGIWDANEAAQQVARLYDTALGRLPDFGGLGYWAAAIESGRSVLLDLAQSFVTSAEFARTYGPLGNQDFVAAIYRNTLGRDGDAAGIEFWTNTLNSGVSRASVTIGFSESAEHQAKTAPNVGGEVPATYGIRFA